MKDKGSPGQHIALSDEDFARFLRWLSPHEEPLTGAAYEAARRHLILFFSARHCVESEVLADKTLDIASRKGPHWPFEANPLAYLVGIAKKVYLEHGRQVKADEKLRETLTVRAAVSATTKQEQQLHACLENCLTQQLSTDERTLLLQYYSVSGQEKIAHRQALADSLGLNLNALRNRILRFNQRLASCTKKCMSE